MKVKLSIRNLLKKQEKTEKSALLNLIIKPISMILAIIYTPLLLKYLGDEKYGLWSTILSIISWINYCDVGIGQGLRNILTKELSEKNINEARKTISTAYVTLSVIALVLWGISVWGVFSLDWVQILHTKIDMRMPLGISFTFICINFVLSLSNMLLYALQISEGVAWRNCIIQILNIIGIVFLSQIGSGNMILISILFGATSFVVYIWNTIIIFSRHKELMLGITWFDKNKILEICDIGIKFFVINISCIALYAVDNLLITNMYGGEATTPFNIVYKAFNSVYAFLAAIIVPYWSKTTVAVAEKDIAWIKKNVRKLNVLAILFCVAYVTLAIGFYPIANVWVGRELNYAPGLVWVMCIYYCVFSVVMVNTQFINGTGKINCQLVCMTIMGISNIPLSVYLAKGCGLGVVGVRMATTILMAIAAVIFPINLYRIIKNLEKDLY